MPRPDLTRVPEFYHNYINQVPENDLSEAFKNEGPGFIHFIETIPSVKYDYRYAENKWTLKEVLQHIIDGERIFAYRALRFARKDPTPLPGFDENLFAENSKASNRNWDDLLNEFKSVRASTEFLFNSFDKEQLESSGISNNHSNYVLAFGFVIIGHCLHHKKIIKERYL
ncbi:MAG TPA: DinB family protein [Chitinophagaceae bacterium]|nr:DinB family protein [Chitinophagaceae bacterium]